MPSDLSFVFYVVLFVVVVVVVGGKLKVLTAFMSPSLVVCGGGVSNARALGGTAGGHASMPIPSKPRTDASASFKPR